MLTSDRVSFSPCICLAICSLRARRAHCAYRRVLSRTDSAPAARNIAPVGASIPHRLFHCQSYWRTHPEPFGARECNTDTPSDQKASRGVPERLRPSQGAPERPGASQSFQNFGSTELLRFSIEKSKAFGHFPRRSYRCTHARPSGVENATPPLEMHTDPVPVVENATPSLEMQPKMQPLRS